MFFFCKVCFVFLQVCMRCPVLFYQCEASSIFISFLGIPFWVSLFGYSFLSMQSLFFHQCECGNLCFSIGVSVSSIVIRYFPFFYQCAGYCIFYQCVRYPAFLFWCDFFYLLYCRFLSKMLNIFSLENPSIP